MRSFRRLLNDDSIIDENLLEVIEFMVIFFQRLNVESRLSACDAIKRYASALLLPSLSECISGDNAMYPTYTQKTRTRKFGEWF